ncbi:MAG: DUF4382 domain-containing protein [Chloroflexi bacterium]|nr:DUF4382 domain-containing protein [Chloroflexota bacterium]
MAETLTRLVLRPYTLAIFALVFLAACGAQVANTPVRPVAEPPPAVEPARQEPGEQVVPEDTSQTPSSPSTTGADDANEPPAENFRLLISDERNAIDDFEHLWVNVTSVGLLRSGPGAGWIDIDVPDAQQTVDLVEVIGEAAVELIQTHMEPGTYNKVFINVSKVTGELATGESVDIKLPSDKLQIDKPFVIDESSVTSFVFDITVIGAGNDKSGVRYILQPVIGESGADQPFSDPVIAKKSKPAGVGRPVETEKVDMPAEVATAVEEPVDDEIEDLFLEIIAPEEDVVFVGDPTFLVSARTRLDAAVSVNDDLVDLNEEGMLEVLVDLEEGPNIIEVVVSVGTGEEVSAVLTIFYLPEEG